MMMINDDDDDDERKTICEDEWTILKIDACLGMDDDETKAK